MQMTEVCNQYEKRDDFNSMIDDCMAGKIDLILTKSVSRLQEIQ